MRVSKNNISLPKWVEIVNSYLKELKMRETPAPKAQELVKNEIESDSK